MRPASMPAPRSSMRLDRSDRGPGWRRRRRGLDDPLAFLAGLMRRAAARRIGTSRRMRRRCERDAGARRAVAGRRHRDDPARTLLADDVRRRLRRAAMTPRPRRRGAGRRTPGRAATPRDRHDAPDARRGPLDLFAQRRAARATSAGRTRALRPTCAIRAGPRISATGSRSMVRPARVRRPRCN